MSKLWRDIQDAEKEAHILQSQAAAEKAPKNEKRTEISTPQSFPDRTSSLGRSDSPKTTSALTDKPPTPPPKNNAPKPPSPHTREGDSVHIDSHKRGFWGSLVVALATCCSPTPTKTYDDPVQTQKRPSQRLKKQSIEMDSLKNGDDQPTTSTMGVVPVVEKPVEPVESPPPVPAKEEPTSEEHKPSVTLAPDTITKRHSVGKRNITPPLGVTPAIEVDDNESQDDELWRKEREIRHSLQIQAPFPPADDTDALVVSPAAPSIPSDEEEDYDINEKRLYSKIDGEEPEAPLLGPTPARRRGQKTLVLDLDECLIHSSFMPERSYDFTISLTLDRGYGTSFVYVKKRPYVIEFLREMAKLYEIVIFTASLDRYANPVLDILDPLKDIDYRLFRESCTRTYDPLNRIYSPNVKNLSLLGRDLRKTIIIDNNHLCYQWHPEHAVPISSWFSDPLDVELKEMIPLLTYLSSDSVTDVRDVLNPEYRILVPAHSLLTQT